jgi:general secretion pathway protein G
MRRDGKASVRSANGLTLIELLVALVILSILAAAALPYAELTVRRDKEYELRRALRDVRTAIDAYHEDWRNGRIPKGTEGASEDGFPRTLAVLVEGVDTGQAQAARRYYLRRIPRDPFAGTDRPPAEQWVLRGYQDAPDARAWGGSDVYDLRSSSAETAIDGTRYRDW